MNPKPKILFVTEAFGGGVFEYCHLLCNRLCNDFEIYLAYGIRHQTPQDFEKYFNSKVGLIRVKSFSRSINAFQDFRAMRELNEIYNTVKPDIVHLHSSKAGALGRILFATKKVPVFYTPHGYSFLMEDKSRIKRSIYYAIEYVLAHTGATTVSCSLGEHKETLRLTQHAQYISNGIDTQEMDRYVKGVQEQEQKKQPFTICTMGRICKQKNPQMVNQVAQLLPDIKFIWIGDGESRSELTASNIEIMGWMERQKAVQTMMSADIMLLPSLWEGLPLTLLEAMYCRRLCIVSDVVGNRDVIQNGRNGMICHTPEEYAKAIQFVRNDPDEEKKMKQKAHDDVMKEYNLEVMGEKYKNLYLSRIKIK